MSADVTFREAMEGVYSAALEANLRQWTNDFGFDRETTAWLLLVGLLPGLADLMLAVSFELPPVLDEFTEEEFCGRVEEIATSASEPQ